jgi:hypothetical protein
VAAAQRGVFNNGEFMKYKSMAALALMTLSANALGSVGLGVTLRDDPTIYVPIDVTDHFRIEPLIRFYNDEYSERVFGESSPYSIREINEFSALELGVGLFGVIPVSDAAQIYVGGRIALVSAEAEQSYDGGSRPVGFNSEGEKSEMDGYTFAPTLGFEYRFGEHFSIAGIRFTSTEDDDEYAQEIDSTSTVTNIVLRYRF